MAGDPAESGKGREEPPEKGCFSMQLTMETETPEDTEQNKGGRRGEQGWTERSFEGECRERSFEEGEVLIFPE